MTEDAGALIPVAAGGALTPLELLQAIPEEQIWLESQQSPETRRAYRSDVAELLAFLRVRRSSDLQLIDRMAVVAWKRHLEKAGAKPVTVRRKLAAISSLFAHLVDRHVLGANPCRDVKRPRVNRREGLTSAFTAAEARKILDSPTADTLLGLRDRALLAVGFHVGARRSEIVHLKVKDFYRNAGYDCLRFRLKGGEDNAPAIHPNAAQRIREYLAGGGHDEDLDGPLFRPVVKGDKAGARRALSSQMVDLLVKKYARAAGLPPRGYSAHSMRATFITTALENGASLEDVQRAAGHAKPDTTRMYDRRGYNPEKAASFFANY